MTQLVLGTGGVDLDLTLAPLAMLAGDPTLRLGRGRLERATLTPLGPGTITVAWDRPAAKATVMTSGPGAAWLAGQAPALLGLLDDPTGFAPETGPLRDLWRRHRGDRVGATGTLWHDLAWFVLQQRVTRAEAATQWSRLVDAFGTRAPGTDGLLVPPAPEVVGRLTYERLHPLGIERQRAEHLIAAARCAYRLHHDADPDPDRALAALRQVRGVGPWTLACLASFTYGSADTVITGDSGIPSMVSWLLAGERRADDARMLQLLEPYRPHRYRVVRLAFAGGTRPPRRASRAPVHQIRGR